MSAFSRTLRMGLQPLIPLKQNWPSYNGYSGNDEKPAFEDYNCELGYRTKNGVDDDDIDEGFPQSKLGNLDDDGFPTLDQMLATGAPVLDPNKIDGHYKSPSEYLRIQFGLMEEDFMCQVRKAVQEYVLKFRCGDTGLKAKDSRVYENVRLKNFKTRNLGKEEVLTCVMDFVNEEVNQPEFGHFFVFDKSSSAELNLFVGMVIEDASQTGEKYSVIRLQFDESGYDQIELENSLFNVIEPDHPFFLAYLCVFNALNGLYKSNEFSNFRMAPYILFGKPCERVKPPEYLTHKTRYRIFDRDVVALNYGSWSGMSPKHLNMSQYTALKRCLTEELALVQGPPGTGKTYFGVQLIKVLLDDNNISVWNPSGRTPLLVVCHSNHALDHFLEGIHKFTDKFVRVGLRCQSEVIKPYCLVELVCRDLAPQDVDDDECNCEVIVKKYRNSILDEEDEDEESVEDSGHGRNDESEEEGEFCPSEYCEKRCAKCYCLPALKRCLDLIDETRKQIRNITEGIVDYKVLHFWGVVDEKTHQYFEGKSQNTFLKWLGLTNTKVERRRNRNENKTDLLVDLKLFSRRIANLKAQKNENLARDMKADWNKIQSIVGKFKQSTRENIFGEANDIFSLTPNDARKIYVKWLDSFSYRLHRTLSDLEKKLYYNFWDNLNRRERYLRMLNRLKSAHVIGLTSTGAAARRSTSKMDENGEEKPRVGILEKIASPIVILEEAAQILESHVVASMTSHCKHLIMLGDHKQLKPNVTTQHLATEYNLNVSLFERLIKNEVVEKTCLTIQNRMRPEIADLLRPHIYEGLRDAPPTRDRPPVRGIPKSLFFLNHRERERKALSDRGYWNPYELDMLLNLCQFLVSMGYLPSEITIISMYNEQRRRLIEERDKNPSLANLEITSVDGFQGKENEIILLSLVRSNAEGNIGFLEEDNRICVALSRARSGLYIMGDMKCLTKHSAMWRNVYQILDRKRAVGPKLNLICDKHNFSRPLSDKEVWNCVSCSEGRKKRQKRRVLRSVKNSN